MKNCIAEGMGTPSPFLLYIDKLCFTESYGDL